jgi:2-oxo-3-hexenedioate decarboxylase
MAPPLEALAARLDDAARTATATPQLSLEHDLSEDDAYAIQSLSIGRRLERGETRVGIKMGLTSRAKMRQVGVHEVIWGQLTDAMRIEDGGTLAFERYVHPRVEPEVAFVLKSRIERPLSPAEVWRHVDAVAPALEVIDSRYENFKFALPDVIADNSSSSSFVLGPWSSVRSDVDNLGLVLSFDGRELQFGSTSAILGHPARSLAAASRLVTERGIALEPGWIVLAGGATAAEPLRPGVAVQLEMQALGRVGFRVEG